MFIFKKKIIKLLIFLIIIFYYEIRHIVKSTGKKLIITLKKGAFMSYLLKISMLSIVALVLSGLNHTLVCMEYPKAQIATYEALFKNLTPQELQLKYYQEVVNLQNSLKEKTTKLTSPTLSQLPIFRVAILKALVAEIKKRKEAILSAEELKKADQLINIEEVKMKAGLEAEKR
jgi:hypothetical protein